MASRATDYRAKTLKQAFRLCNLGALTGVALNRYRVDLSAVRNEAAIDSVSRELDFLDPGEPAAILFTGHRGCGKSTELRRLEQQWQLNYEVIYVRATDELDINDADYKDIYLVIIKYITQALHSWGLSPNAKLLKAFEDWFKEITGESEESVTKSVSLGAEAEAGQQFPFIFKLAVKLLSEIKGSDSYKRTVRENLQQGFSRLRDNTNALLKDAYSQLTTKKPNCKGFLLIFDNLDRVPPQVGEHLFLKYANQLRELQTVLVYTVPISVIYSGGNYSNAFGNLNVMPMVNIYQYDPDAMELVYRDTGLTALVELLAKRVDVETLFASREALMALVKLSGGHVRQLMQLMRQTCLLARGPQITVEDVTRAAAKEKNNFERFIPREHYPVLAQVCRTKAMPAEPEAEAMMQSMLFNITVLEYEEGDDTTRRWLYVNPLVRQIDALQQLL
ncbi:AAA family ATPase [Leptolyngbya sp. PCC 6406]|uniref:AAA family ATPase n=1 Tax=Leptolyngbya sp. PCC 6406 TaxID=1173264 RepID=UPI0002D43087|nr:AAA family ATPase [Leptolyngbya sp. PCC 6406]